MENKADLELINRAQAGDHLSYAALVERHYMTVYRFAYRWCRAKEDAEDITQDVFIRLAGKIHLFDNRSKFTTWLYRMTANCASDYARKNSRLGDRILPGPPEDTMIASPNPGPENNVMDGSIRKAIETLPDKQKEAVLLVYAEGMSHREAAGVIGCAETTVSWRIFQAKRKLRKVLS